MERFFDYPASLWAYFHDVDRRFTESGNISPKPCPVDTYGNNLGNVRVVLWDVYGTLCGVGLGDLEKSLEDLHRLQIAAQATINEFSLEPALTQIYPHQSPAQALRDRYLQLIDESHQRSLWAGIEYPEVVIENIWENILQDCCRVGYQPPCPEESIYTAYRLAYFFDVSLQKTYLYPGIMECLSALNHASIVQGIISNAQFYTPLHLRRLFRLAQKQDNFALDDIFTDTLVFFSYELGCSKPNPQAFIQALDILDTMGFAPPDILYIGNDMLNDVWTAARFDLPTVLFAADSTQTNLRPDDPRCTQLKPNAIVTNPASITQMILTNQ